MARVDLGFLDDCEDWRLTSRLFPSKFGGKPAWLNLDDLPTAENLECSGCKNPMIFLCQIYAPYEDDPNNFHRTLFVFICRNVKCSKPNNSDNVKVFRSSLRRENKFYSFEPPAEEDDKTFTLSKWVRLCELCGCLSNKNCSKCKNTYYCSRAHQVADWNENHKTQCGTSDKRQLSSSLFPEMEIVMDREVIREHRVDEQLELKKFKQMEISQKTGTFAEVSESDLECHAKEETDKTFSRFKKRVEHNPGQVIRYERGGEPLWIAEEPVPENVPKCELCGSARQLEFQIMPQTLSLIKEHELDWGVIVVYTCRKSCTNDEDYKKEYVFKQDITEVQQ